jgi:phosphatidate cytidylyltransferase
LLKTRILTAVVLAPAGIAMIFLAPAWVFSLVVILIMLTGTWEFRRLAGLRTTPGVSLLALQILIMALMFLYWPIVTGYAFTILLAGCFAWCLMFLRLARYGADQAPDQSFQAASFLSALAGITICTFSLALLRDQAHGEFLILLLLIIIWAADIGAYFSGRYFGRTKLAPVISPKKTWEGVVGGIVLAAIAALLLTPYIPGLETAAGPVIILVAVTVLTSVGGDLFISIHKRTVQIKDCGKLFPGHGGVLDRFDSLLAGAPFFTLGVWILDW